MPTQGVTGGIHYEVIGTGQPVVLLHGMMGSSAMWHFTGWVERLADLRLVLIDARGHGRSASRHDPMAYSPENDADDVVGVLDELKIERAPLVGMSMGAAIALHAAAYHPSRISAVGALGLPGGLLAFADVPAPPVEESLGEADSFERDGTRPVVEALETEGRPEWVGMVERADGHALAARMRGLTVAPRDLRLRDIRQPMLVVWAAEEVPDTPLPLPDQARVLVIPDVDHLGVVERPDMLIPELRSLFAL